MKILISTLLILITSNIYSATVAILDNGVDYTHSKLELHIRKNLLESYNGRDNDNNSYVDDVLGWNFIEMNNKVFDFDREIYLTSDIERYYFLKSKNSLGTITDAEKSEYNELKKDDDLKERRSALTSWMHGTHVAGIASSTNHLPKEVNKSDIGLYSIVYLGSAKSGPAKAPEFTPINSNNSLIQQRHLNKYWDDFMKWQLNKFQLGVDYAAANAQVVNGSFGQSFEGIQNRMKSYFEDQFGKKMGEELSYIETQKFMKKLISESAKILKKHPTTLFTFSAGNKKNNSDKLIHFPSAIRLPNSLSVGASFDYKEMAYFSNYGKETVDLFAPGLAVTSSIPRQGELTTNGTSQAAPFIANIAAKSLALAKNLEVKLTIQSLKKIILKTVITRDDLKNKSVSEGIVFPERVYQAIRNLKKYKVNKSIRLAKEMYPTKKIKDPKISEQGLLLDLPTP